MGHRLRRVAMLLLGAVLLGTVGLSLGSWYGGRGVTPPSDDQAQSLAAHLLPGAVPGDSSLVEHGYRWGVSLAADDLGSGHTSFWYHDGDDCGLAEKLRRSAVTQGWQGLRRVPGYLCDGWRAERDGLTVTLDYSASGAELTIAPAAPGKFLPSTVAGTLAGAAAGAALFGWVARRRRPVRLLVCTLVTAGLLPGVALTWTALGPGIVTEPVWPVWPALAALLVPLWLVLLLVGVYAFPKRETETDSSSRVTAVVVSVACALAPVVMVAALLFMFVRAQPDRPTAVDPVVPWPTTEGANVQPSPSFR
ncbi:hypothetical protein MED01_002293 [Micromonospora sp. MED01]|uniref:hypothetical protein n=1 Tax=Micromonospora alfalfae TaxID=2911212 RepID=UPI001EE89468|nr:hypothetical protein [Micromonospora alfalfae]MCG5464130.1 hypothetical protein [Micromonospora alfalfae]